nr:transposase [Leifsonia sp. AG29]
MDTTEMIDPVTREITNEQQLAQQLLKQAKEHGVDLVGPGELLNGLAMRVLEVELEAETTEQLGHAKHQQTASGNIRNGSRSKTVLTGVGPVEIVVPRDREG